MMQNKHPLLRLALNSTNQLTLPGPESTELCCPTCLRPVCVDRDGQVVHTHEEAVKMCLPSINVVISMAMLEVLADGLRVFVKPVKKGNKTLGPGFIFVHDGLKLRPYINPSYQPSGASWKSDKGYRLGLFFMEGRAGGVNKEEYDYIAVINPKVFIQEFDARWSRAECKNPLKLLRELFISENISAEWIKWPDKVQQTGNENYSQASWYDYYSTDSSYHAKTIFVASVTGLDGNSWGETIYILQASLNNTLSEYQLVRSMDSILLLDNTGDLVSPACPDYDLIFKTCVSVVKKFVRQNPKDRALDQMHTNSA